MWEKKERESKWMRKRENARKKDITVSLLMDSYMYGIRKKEKAKEREKINRKEPERGKRKEWKRESVQARMKSIGISFGRMNTRDSEERKGEKTVEWKREK